MPEQDNHHHKTLQQLLRKYRQGKATEQEARFLETYDAWFDQSDYDPVLAEEDAAATGSRIYRQLDKKIGHTRTIQIMRLVAVAAVFLALTAATWLWLRQQGAPPSTNLAALPAKQPGTNKATLTLSDGSTVQLDSMNTAIADPAGAHITNLSKGRLSYTNGKGDRVSPIAYNTLTTPRGGQYQVVLPDGSEVWLNAASSLRYPTVFAGTDRRVSITGEAYFKINKDVLHPFIVSYHETEVQVLGTEFNIMAYPDEPAMQTTLVSGSIRLQQQGQQQLLTPGSMLVQQGQEWKIQQADIAQVTAWKNGYFQFYRAALPEVMRQLSRWYDVDIHLQKNSIEPYEFVGKINRDAPFALVLKMLKENKVNYKTENGKLIVY